MPPKCPAPPAPRSFVAPASGSHDVRIWVDTDTCDPFTGSCGSIRPPHGERIVQVVPR